MSSALSSAYLDVALLGGDGGVGLLQARCQVGNDRLGGNQLLREGVKDIRVDAQLLRRHLPRARSCVRSA
jgi:hypothetical protein